MVITLSPPVARIAASPVASTILLYLIVFLALWTVSIPPNVELINVVLVALDLIVPTPLMDTFSITAFLPFTDKEAAVTLATLAPAWTVKAAVALLLDTTELELTDIAFAVLL